MAASRTIGRPAGRLDSNFYVAHPTARQLKKLPDTPYIIEGLPHYDSSHMARIVGVPQPTALRWMQQDRTSWGFTLGVKHYQAPTDIRYTRRKADDFRLVVPESSVIEVKDYLGKNGLPARKGRPKKLTELQMIEAASMFYERDLKKKDIAKHFQIDGRTVTSILKELRRTGKVEIAIDEAQAGLLERPINAPPSAALITKSL
jgi:transposase